MCCPSPPSHGCPWSAAATWRTYPQVGHSICCSKLQGPAVIVPPLNGHWFIGLQYTCLAVHARHLHRRLPYI